MQNLNEIKSNFWELRIFLNTGNALANQKTELHFTARRSLKPGWFEVIAYVGGSADKYHLLCEWNKYRFWHLANTNRFYDLKEFCVEWLNNNHKIILINAFTDQQGIEIGTQLIRKIGTLFVPVD